MENRNPEVTRADGSTSVVTLSEAARLIIDGSVVTINAIAERPVTMEDFANFPEDKLPPSFGEEGYPRHIAPDSDPL